MTFRPFARHPLAVCLLLFAILIANSTIALAKVYMVNGQDGAEGDPTDGNDFIGGGSSDLIEPDSAANRPGEFQSVLVPGMIFFLVSPNSDYLFTLRTDDYRALQDNLDLISGGSR